MRRLKAEWEKQEAILMVFPHKNSDWKYYLEEARETFLQIIKAILPYQKVLLCLDCNDLDGREFINSRIKDANLIITTLPTNDTWARDFGVISVERGEEILCLDFGFNGWGLKFPSNFDNQISSNLFKQGFLPNLNTQELILEGGSIDTDGEGVLLTNTQCLLEKNRNPYFNQKQIEQKLKDSLGVQQVLWLHHGYLAGDDTDSHIDTLARFLNKDTIAYIYCEDEEDEHYKALQNMQIELQKLRNKNHQPYHLVPLPLPKIYYKKERLPASYANFLIINQHQLLLPIYNDTKSDLAAIAALQPYYEVIPIDCSILIRQHGSLHCVTMQLYELL